MTTLFWLLFAHAVCDYPLQGDFLAKGKNHKAPLAGVPWWICLVAHSLIHGGGVALATGSVTLGACETVLHAGIDYRKCDGGYGFAVDQSLHVACKILWVLVLVSM